MYAELFISFGQVKKVSLQLLGLPVAQIATKMYAALIVQEACDTHVLNLS